ncbi:unnamed protein product [Rhizophagus irregularis]|nr:unnamed protein product [Rhizophagus irregularis]
MFQERVREISIQTKEDRPKRTVIRPHETPQQWANHIRDALQELLSKQEYSIYHVYYLFSSFGQGVTKTYHVNSELKVDHYSSAAAGSIGQFVGQIAKIKGLRVVFLLNLMRKLLNKLKFDVAFNYKKVDFDKELSKHCPNCIDILFDNVGGETLDIVIDHCNMFACIVICDIISQYNITNPEEIFKLKHVERILLKAIRIQGFIVL